MISPKLIKILGERKAIFIQKVVERIDIDEHYHTKYLSLEFNFWDKKIILELFDFFVENKVLVPDTEFNEGKKAVFDDSMYFFNKDSFEKMISNQKD